MKPFVFVVAFVVLAFSRVAVREFAVRVGKREARARASKTQPGDDLARSAEGGAPLQGQAAGPVVWHSAPTDPAMSEGPLQIPSGGPPGSDPSLLLSVRVYASGSTDRVELAFKGQPPSCTASYVEQPDVTSASGQTRQVVGSAFIQIECSPASGFDATSDPPSAAYRGPHRVVGNTKNVTEARLAGDATAVLTWIVGVAHRAPMTIRVMTGEHTSSIVITVSQ